MTDPIVLTIDELTIRTLEVEDTEALFDLIDRNREHLSQFGEATAKDNPDIQAVGMGIVNPHPPQLIRFGVWNSELAGSVDLYPVAGAIQFAYFLGKEFQGKGYMTRAVIRLLDGIINLPAIKEPESIPHLITEVSSLFSQGFIKKQIVSGW